MMNEKVFQKKWFIIIVAIVCLCVGFIIGFLGKDTGNIQENTEIGQNTEQTVTTEEQFMNDVKTTLQNYLDTNSPDEKLNDVYFSNGKLWVCMDMSSADTSMISIEHLAIHETASFTDLILELNEYTDLWNTIIIDFGEVGFTNLNKELLEEKSTGGYYFPLQDIPLIMKDRVFKIE